MMNNYQLDGPLQDTGSVSLAHRYNVAHKLGLREAGVGSG